MAENTSAGPFRIGDTLLFHVSSRTDLGADEGTFIPTHYDVFRVSDQTLVETDRALQTLDADYPQVFIPEASDLVTISGGSYIAGEAYVICVKEGTGDAPSVYKTIDFKLEQNSAAEEDQVVKSTRFIDLDDFSDAAASSTGELDTVLGRLHTIERNQVEVIFPRIKRILGLQGEHQLVDGYLYDEAGNHTECRVRIFNTKVNRDDATVWNNRTKEPDPAPALETGEIYRITILASHFSARNLRQLYQGVINTDQADNDFTASVQ